MSEQSPASAGRIAFLGLGHMGEPMAVNLIKAGFDVVGFDVVPAAVDAAVGAGVPCAASAIEAATGARIVLTMFPSGDILLDAYGPGADPGLAERTRFLGCCHALSAYAEARDGRIPISLSAAVAQLERVFAGAPR